MSFIYVLQFWNTGSTRPRINRTPVYTYIYYMRTCIFHDKQYCSVHRRYNVIYEFYCRRLIPIYMPARQERYLHIVRISRNNSFLKFRWESWEKERHYASFFLLFSTPCADQRVWPHVCDRIFGNCRQRKSGTYT